MIKKRVCIVYFLFLGIVLLLCARLYVIADNGSSAEYALSGQYTRRLDIAERDGFIFDRKGKMLDDKKDGYILFVNPDDVSESDYFEAAEALSAATGGTSSYYIEKLFRGEPFTAVSETKLDTEYSESFPKYKKDDSTRLCHLLGYKNSDGMGVSGIRYTYNEYLTEHSAGSVFARYEADAAGGVMDGGAIEICDMSYSEMNGIYLTIDSQIQDIVENIADSHIDMGAVVVQDTDSGELLAVVSRPFYSREKIEEYLSSDRGELLNRAFLAYTPGSVFKTVVAAAALESNITVEREYECTGVIDVFGEKIRCHNLAGHGKLSMKEAFSESCNPYFIDLGLELGANKITDMAKKLGVGRYSSINLVSVSEGKLPEENLTLPALVANTSVGQGELLLSPVQVCSIISSAATGKYVKPSLVLKLRSSGEEACYGSSESIKVLRDETVAELRLMLSACVSDGTGYRAESDIVTAAGKTATAQSGQMKDGKEVIHSWFAGYFPADDPKYTVCVMCDGNGTGNENPAAVFKIVAEKIYESVLS